MSELEFDRDQQKSDQNRKKHGISFEEAKSVFLDPSARLIADPDHSGDEDRFILLGMSERIRILVVCHCYRHGEVIRIISARKAISRETKIYEENL